MQHIKKTNRSLTTALSAALIAVFIFFAMPFAAFEIKNSRADGDYSQEFAPTSLGVTNTQFSETSGGSPATPTGWTGASLGGKGNVVGGVVDLSSAYNSAGSAEESANKLYKLDQYPEYMSDDSVPRTIFGTPDYEGTDTKTLMINTALGATAAYAYTSSDMTFERNSYYRVSAWVKTGNFAADTGATIKLTGLGEYVGFPNINTVKNLAVNETSGLPELTESNRYGWVKYTMYVRTSASLSHTVKLSLGIGDVISEDEENTEVVPNHAHGYAFFDTVDAERISAFDFAFETSTLELSATRDNCYVDSTGTTIAIDLYDTDYLTVDGKEIGTFSQNTDMWKNAEPDDEDDHVYSGTASAKIYNTYETLDTEDNALGLSQYPRTPLGKAEDTAEVENPMFVGTNGNVLMIGSVYDKKTETFSTGAAGKASPDVTIERFGYYRFSVWTKGDKVSGGNGISIGVLGQSNNSSTDNKLNQWYNNLDGDSSAAAQYGWKEQVVYIVGSALNDCTVHFELWLGSPTAQSSGIALFDNVTFTKLSYSDYVSMSGADGGNVVNLDSTLAETGIANGNFMTIDDYDEFEYPLPAANWSFFPAHAAPGDGSYSLDEVDSDNVKHGIVPVDDKTFDEIRPLIPGISDPKKFANAPLYNALVISSTTPTAFAYQSAAFTAATDTAYKLTVEMAVDGVYDGYGASLVLKTSNNKVVSTIENITSTANNYKQFVFYIDAPRADVTLNLEIWLGLNDRNHNDSKLSEGNIYVKSVSFASWTPADGEKTYADISAEYLDAIHTSAVAHLDYGVVSFAKPSFDYYDAYSYAQGSLAAPYLWNISKADGSTSVGIFNAEHLNGLDIYDGFDASGESGNMLLIYNKVDSYTTAELATPLAIAANTYYRLDVTVKVRLPKDAVDSKTAIGANISLTGTVTETFENIKDTSTLVMQGNEDSRNYETFKTYTFFISSGDNGGEIGLTLSLGGEDRLAKVQGRLIVSNIELTSINNTAYDTAKDSLTDYQKAVELSETDTSDDDNDDAEVTPNDIAWWIIPTVIFSTALVAVIVVIIVLRIRDAVKKKHKKSVKYTSEYDRAATVKKLDKLAEAQNKADNDSPAPATDSAADAELDDEIAPATEQSQEPTVEPEPETAEQDTTPTTDNAASDKHDNDLDD